MRIVHDYPPLYDAIDAAFGLELRKDVFRPIFAWGSSIYNPHHVKIPPALIAHESVHGRRQGGDIVGWWRRYIDDQKFRLAEEIPAHVAEYRALARGPKDRAALVFVAKRMASPLYGYRPALPVQIARVHLDKALREAA